MATEIEKARVTELHVRMDCSGCVQKIKKALHSIDGVYDVYVDYPQQKITVVGKVEPEILLKAIKKTKKTATVCSHTDPTAAASSEPPPSEAPPAESAPPTADDAPPIDAPSAETPEVQELRDVEEEAHMVHYYPHNHVHGEHWKYNFPGPIHSYSSQRPSQYVSGYVSEYGHDRLYYQNRGGDSNQITSIFSDENPNACRIV